MAFNLANWGVLTGNASLQTVSLQNGGTIGAPNIFTYTSSADTINTISSPDYFTPVAFQIRVGDAILIDGSDHTDWFKISEVDAEAGTVLIELFAGPDEGYVQGPASTTDSAVAVWNGVTGKLLRNSNAFIDNAGNATLAGTLLVNGNTTLLGNVSIEKDSSLLMYDSSNLHFVAFNAGTPSSSTFYTWPQAYPASTGYVLTTDLSGNMSWTPNSATGTVIGPGSSTNNAFATWNGTTGTALFNTTATLDSSGNIVTSGTLTSAGITINAANNLVFYNSGNTFYTQLHAGSPTANTTYTLPITVPAASTGYFLTATTAGVMSWAAGATGNVTGPGSSTNKGIATWNGTSGTALNDNPYATIDASGNLLASTVQGNVVTGGTVQISGSGALKFYNPSSTASISFSCPTSPTTFTYTWPTAPPVSSTGYFLTATTGGVMAWAAGAVGNVTGPGGSTNNGIATWNGTGGTVLNSNPYATIDGSGNLLASTVQGNVVTGGTYVQIGGSGSLRFYNPSVTASISFTCPASPTTITYTLPSSAPASSTGYYLTSTTGGGLSWATSGTVTGPGSSTATAIALWNGTAGTSLLNSTSTIDASGNLIVNGNISVRSSNTLYFYDSSNVHYTSLRGSPVSNASYVMPPAYATSNNQVLASDTSGNMYWVSNAAAPAISVSTTPITLAVNTTYIINAGASILNMPTTLAVGDTIEIVGTGTPWTVQLNTVPSQTVSMGNISTLTGGTLVSADGFAAVKLICTTANSFLWVTSAVANLTFN